MQSTTVGGYELNLEEYWQVILRRRWIIIFCAISLGVASWFFTWIKQPPPIYSSSASVKIESSSNLTEILIQGGNFRQRDDMDTQLAVIQSFALMERVAKRMGKIPAEVSTEDIRSNDEYMGVVLDLKDSISAEQEGISNIINISAASRSPEFARDLAQAVADEFREYSVESKNRQVIEAKRFIEQQLLVVGERLKKSEEMVRDYRKSNSISMLGENSEVMAKVVGDLEQEYRQSAVHLNDLSFALEQLRQRIKNNRWDYQAVSVSGSVSTYFDELNKRLVEMAIKHTELATDFTDEHPQIVELSEQAAEILDSMVEELAEQVALTKKRMADIQKGMDESEARYQGKPEQLLELQRMKRSVRINEELHDLLEKKYQEVLIKEAEKVREVSLVRPALLSYMPINAPRTSQTALAGLILGLVLGLIIALILEAMDSSIGTIEEVESFLDVPVMGFVPHLGHDDAVALFEGVENLQTSGHELERQIRLITHFSPPSTIAEAYRSMRTNLLFSQVGQHKIVLVTSSTIKEGKSTVAANLAVVIAQQGSRVLLIDADMRKPMQHHTFGIERTPGLSECLLGQISWNKAVRRFSDVMLGDMGIDQALITPGLDQLDILTCGKVDASPPDLLGSPALTQIFDEVREAYDMVIIDMPPLLHTTDATVVASKVDGVLLVYHIGAVVRGALKRVKGSIESVGGKVLGVVLNGVRGELSSDYAKYKMDSYYSYAYGEDGKERLDTVSELLMKAKHLSRKLQRMIVKLLRAKRG